MVSAAIDEITPDIEVIYLIVECIELPIAECLMRVLGILLVALTIEALAA